MWYAMITFFSYITFGGVCLFLFLKILKQNSKIPLNTINHMIYYT